MNVSLSRALSIASEAHHGQTRRHGSPYIEHPVAVARIVDEIGEAVGIHVDDGVRAAALLHDVIEDSDIGAAELGARFGDAVASRVLMLTKTGKGDEATRKYYATMTAEAGDDVKLLKTCDRLHNLSELHLSPDESKLKKYVDETLEHVVPMAASAKVPGAAAGLVAALHDAIRAASRAQQREVPAPARLEGSGSVPCGVYAIVDDARRAQALLDGGVALIQLRAKGKSDRAVLALLEELIPLCAKQRVPVVVNDRADLAAIAGAGGVHVGQDDLPPQLARRLVGPAVIVGTSTHTEPELLDAVAGNADDGADHVAVGPVFASTTKTDHAPVVGLEALARRVSLANAKGRPIVAIGGITSPARVALCAKAGAQLVATVSAVAADDARAVCRRMSLAFFAARGTAAATKGSR